MSIRPGVRRVADSILGELWGAGRWLTGRAISPGRSIAASGTQRVLVIAPHPDDEVAGCGGTILLHQRAGDAVTLCHVTDGRRSRSLDLSPDDMARVRHREAGGCVRALGVGRWDWMGLPEGDWTAPDLAGRLERLIADADPQVVYLPSRVDFHPEHYRVAVVAAGVLKKRPGVLVRAYQVHVPLTGILANVAVSIAEVFPALLEAGAAYPSQEASLRSCMRLKRYAARAHRLPGAAEEFWEMSAASFAAIHASEPERPLVETFRGLRRFAVSDPLAFLRGRHERRRLQSIAAAASR